MHRAAPLGVFVTALAVYVATCATTVQGGDSGQFTMLAAIGGTAHPPGYPVLTQLLVLAGQLPVSPAFSSALVSALCAAGALAVLTAGLRSRGWAAALAAGALAFAPTFWSYAVVAEVFALAALSVSLVVFVSWRIAEGARGWRWQLALGLAVATGIANHHSVVFLAPLAVWAWVRAFDAWDWRGVAAVVAGFAPGFASYLLLMLPGGGWRWGDTSSVGGVVDAFLRRDFGTFSLTIHDSGVAWYEHPLLYVGDLPRNLVGVFLALAVLGAVASLRGPRRGFHLALLASWILSGVGFLALFNVPSDGLGRAMAARFHIPSLVLLVPFIALGIERLGRARLVQPLLALCLVVHAALGWPECDRRSETTLEDYVVNTLEAVEPDALIVGNTDGLFYGMMYAQEVLGVRQDVVFVHPLMLAWPWYRDRVEREHPGFEPRTLAEPRSVAFVLRESWEVRPIYLSQEWAAVPDVTQPLPGLYPAHASLMRVLGPGEVLPPPARVEQEMAAAEAAFTFRSDPAGARSYGVWARDQYAGAWRTLARAYEASGDAPAAARCLERAARYEVANGS